MTYKADKWKAIVKKTIEDFPHVPKTSGLICAIAGARYIRDELKDDLGEEGFASAGCKECFSELIVELQENGCKDGFLSNASAAAKAAGFKSVEREIGAILED